MTLQGGALAALLRSSAWLPLAANRALGTALGALAARLPNRTREVARRNLEICFPELEPARREILLRAFLSDTGRGLAELGIVWLRSATRVLAMAESVHGRRNLEQGLAGGKGVLVISPHLGSWEFLVQFLASQGRCTFIYRQPRDAGVDRIITRGRQRLGALLVKAGPGAVRKAIRGLKRGEIVGLMPDQQPKLGQGEFSPFFKIPALTMVLASKLAQRSSARVLFAIALRLPGSRGYEVHLEPGHAAIGGDDLEASMGALNAQIEALVRRWPAQYQWGYKRFSIRPPGAPPIYQGRR